LAKYPNVAVKATGQAGYAEDEYPFRSLHPHLQRCFDAFGPERMFWGTDITRMLCSWWQCVTLFTEELRWLKGRDLELVMGEARIASPAAMSGSPLMLIPKNRLRATSAAFGDGGIHTQWPKIIAKLFIGPSPMAGSVHGLAH
jgi:hypothetical protein